MKTKRILAVVKKNCVVFYLKSGKRVRVMSGAVEFINDEYALENLEKNAAWIRWAKSEYCKHNTNIDNRDKLTGWEYWCYIRAISIRTRAKARPIKKGRAVQTFGKSMLMASTMLNNRMKNLNDIWSRWATNTASSQRKRIRRKAERLDEDTSRTTVQVRPNRRGANTKQRYG